MPTSVTESNAYTTSVIVPNDTESATQASLLQFVQPLTNRTKYFKGLFDNGPTWANGSTNTWASGSSIVHQNGSTDTYNASSTLNLNGSVNVNSGYFFVLGTSLFSVANTAFMAVNGLLTVFGEMAGDSLFTGNKTCTGSFTFTSPGACNVATGSTFTCQPGSTCSLNGTVSINGQVTLGANTSIDRAFGGTGYVSQKYYDGIDADDTLNPGKGDVIFADALTAARIWTFQAFNVNGYRLGSRMMIRNDSIYALTIKNEASVTIAVVRASASVGQYKNWVEIMIGSSGDWRVVAGQIV